MLLHDDYSLRLISTKISIKSFQKISRIYHRLCSMAEAVFFVHAELGHGLAQFGQEENRVVTKATGAALQG